MKRLIALAAIALVGCAAQKPLVTKVETIELPPVPIYEKCFSAADVPPVPPVRMPKSGNVEQLAAAASASVRELRSYAEKADALIKSCVE